MGQIASTIYSELSYANKMKKDQFLIVPNIIYPYEKTTLLTAINKVTQHKWCIKTTTANNSTVINKKRTQTIIYLHRYQVHDDLDNEIGLEINGWLRHISSIIGPAIEPIIDRFLINFVGLKRNNYYIQRVMLMEVPPGEPEQQVHQDGDEGDLTYYMFIPLNYWSSDMGGTVYYKDSIVGKIRKVGYDSKRKKGYYSPPNKGFLKDNKFSELYNSARVKRQLKFGDISCHSSITLHHGSENKSNKTRKGLFVVIQAEDPEDDFKNEWVDAIDIHPELKIPIITAALKNVMSRNPNINDYDMEEGEMDDDSNPYANLPEENYQDPDMFKS